MMRNAVSAFSESEKVSEPLLEVNAVLFQYSGHVSNVACPTARPR